jgi:uncharacterized membrane protein
MGIKMAEHSLPTTHQPLTAGQVRSVDDLTKQNIALIARLDDASKAKRTTTDRVVDQITGFCGRMAFVWVHVVWFGSWLFVNLWPHTPKPWRVDPYPFQLLALLVALEAIFLSTFILISQNRQGRLAERRSHLDLQINLLSEQENTKMLAMLTAIQKHLGIHDGDPQAAVMQEVTDPNRLVQQIEAVIECEA